MPSPHCSQTPDLGLDGLSLTWDKAQVWLATVGLRILATIVLAAISLWLLRRLIDRVVATMTSKSARRLAESGRAGRVLATATGLDNERQRQRVETVGFAAAQHHRRSSSSPSRC